MAGFDYISPEDIAPYQTGSNSPNPGEAMRRFKATERYYEMQRYALAQDRRVNAVTAGMGQMFKGSRQSIEKWATETDPGRVSHDLVGIAASRGLLGGGNPVGLISGMLSANGMNQFKVGGLGGMSALSGGGLLTDMITKKMYDAFQQKAFTSMGAANMNFTQGFNKDSMGDIFKLMGQRGMMSGLKMGGFGINDGSAAMNGGMEIKANKGKLSFLEDKNAMQGVLKQFEGVTKMLANVRDLVGDRHVTELARAAESLTGLSLRNANPAKLGERLNRVRDNAAMLNLDVESYMGAHQQLVEMTAPLVGRPMAATMALRAGETAGVASMGRTQMVAEAARRGEHLANFSTGEMAAQGIRGQLQIMSENPQLLEAAFAAQNLEGDKKAALDAAIGKFSGVSSREEKYAASANLRKVFQETTGLATGTYSRQYSTQRMLNTIGTEGHEKLSDAVSGMDQAMNKNVITQQMALNKNFGEGAVAGLGAKQMGGSMHAFMSMAPDEQQAILDSLKLGGVAGISAAQGVLDNASKVLGEGGISKDALAGLHNIISGGGASGDFLKKSRSILAGDSRLQDIVSPEMRKRAKEAAAMKYYADNAVGDVDDRSRADWTEQFYQGLVGGTKADNQSLLFMADKKDVQTFAIDPDTKMPVVTGDLTELLDTYGSPGSDFSSAIKDKTGSARNSAMLAYMKNKGVALDINVPGGKARMINADTKEKTSKRAQFKAEAASELSLEGKGGAAYAGEIDALAKKKESEAGNYEKGSVEEKTAAMQKRTGDSEKLWTGALESKGGWMDKALRAGDDNAEFNTALKRAKEDPAGFANDLKKARADLGAENVKNGEGANHASEKLKKLAALEDKLKDAKATPEQKLLSIQEKTYALLNERLKK